MIDQTLSLVVASVIAGTPLVYAALGELVAERSGVLNLGVEGMMLTGAITAFAVVAAAGSVWLGVAAAMLAAMALSLLFAVLTVSLQANQVAIGLALSIFGTGAYSHLSGDFKDSPIVDDRGSAGQWLAALGLAYTF